MLLTPQTWSCISYILVNSSRPDDAYMHQYNISSLLQIMARRLFGAKPLSEPMLPYYQLDKEHNISAKFYLRFKSFHSRKSSWKCRLPEWRSSCPASLWERGGFGSNHLGWVHKIGLDLALPPRMKMQNLSKFREIYSSFLDINYKTCNYLYLKLRHYGRRTTKMS